MYIPFLQAFLILIFLFQHILDTSAFLSYTALEIKWYRILLQNGSVYSKIQHNPHGKSKLDSHRILAATHYFFPFHFLTKHMALKKRHIISANKSIFKSHCFDSSTGDYFPFSIFYILNRCIFGHGRHVIFKKRKAKQAYICFY